MKNARIVSLLSAAVVLALGVAAARADTVSGTIAGVFTNPAPAGATVTGVGTNDFTWGRGVEGSGPSSMIFTALTPFTSVPFETPFKLGTLEFHNGTISGNSGASSVKLQTTLNFSEPAVGPESFAFTMGLINTTNSGGSIASADYVDFPSAFPSTLFSYNGVDYTLKVTGFENVSDTNKGVVTSSNLAFHVLEGKSATADLYAEVTRDVSGVGSNVPEPASLAVLGVGAVGLLLRRRKTA